MTGPRRSDARRNRAAIMAVVGDSVRHGLRMPSATRIAHLTGLGQATVYRHFPDRRSLLLAVTHEQLGLLRQAARRDADDPAAFHGLLREVMVHQVLMRPLVEELRGFPAADQRGCARRLLDALRVPFARSRAAGHLRRNVVLDDVAVVLAMLQGAVEATPTPEAARRVIPVLLDGLFRAGAGPGAGVGDGAEAGVGLGAGTGLGTEGGAGTGTRVRD
ncbi:TetR/AcrR family transcriptional regulator [Saccharothrix xinjiangensis]|uniref:TetR/AcrR family transcriptional regulator n=1 Tax=Saccharothrix xinjiangensis TaxID=204798 RepID=A0ABV9YBZ9_9PSEU